MLGMFVRSWQLGGGNGPGPVKKVGDVNQMKLRYGGRGRGRRRGRSLGSAAAGPLSAPRGKAKGHSSQASRTGTGPGTGTGQPLALLRPLRASPTCTQALSPSLFLSRCVLRPAANCQIRSDRIVPSLRARACRVTRKGIVPTLHKSSTRTLSGLRRLRALCNHVVHKAMGEPVLAGEQSGRRERCWNE